jgi:hypothetical protein
MTAVLPNGYVTLLEAAENRCLVGAMTPVFRTMILGGLSINPVRRISYN